MTSSLFMGASNYLFGMGSPFPTRACFRELLHFLSSIALSAVSLFATFVSSTLHYPLHIYLPTMKLAVKISFDNCRKINAEVKPSDTVADVIAKIRAQEGIDSNTRLNLFNRSLLLDESKAVEDCDNINGQNSNMVLSIVGPLGRLERSM